MKARHLYIPMIAMLMAACGDNSDYRNAIPSRSAAVVSIDISSISRKSGLSGEPASKGLLDRLENMVKSGLAGSEGLIEKIFKDASESGLGLKDKIYVFAGEQAKTGGLLVKVTDSERLENILEVLRKQRVCEPVKEAEGCKWTVIGSCLVAYNDAALIFASDNKWGDPQGLVWQVSTWLRQKKGEGFSATDDFKAIEGKNGDIIFWSSLDVLPQEAVYPLTMGVSAEIKMKDVKFLSVVDFLPGKTVVDIETMISDKVVMNALEKKQSVTSEIKGSFLDMFPSNTPFWMTGNIKGEEFYDFLCGNPSVRRFFEKSMIPLDFRSVFSAINGDVALAMSDSGGSEFIAYADIKSDNFLKSFESLKSLASLTGGQVVLKNYGDKGYEFKTYDGRIVGLPAGPSALWIGVKGGKLYVTNKETLIDRRMLGLSLRNRKWGNRIEGQRFFMASDLSSLKRILGLRQLKGTMPLVSAFFSGLDCLTVESGDGNNLHIEILMKDQNKNPLVMLSGISIN